MLTAAIVVSVPLVASSVVGHQRADVTLGTLLLWPTAVVAVLLAAAGPTGNRARKVFRAIALVGCALFCAAVLAAGRDVAIVVTLTLFAAAVLLTVVVDATVP